MVVYSIVDFRVEKIDRKIVLGIIKQKMDRVEHIEVQNNNKLVIVYYQIFINVVVNGMNAYMKVKILEGVTYIKKNRYYKNIIQEPIIILDLEDMVYYVI